MSQDVEHVDVTTEVVIGVKDAGDEAILVAANVEDDTGPDLVGVGIVNPDIVKIPPGCFRGNFEPGIQRTFGVGVVG
jgi:hypothetical protein